MDSYRINKLKHVSCTWNDEQLGLGDLVFNDVRVLDRDQNVLVLMNNQNRTFYLGQLLIGVESHEPGTLPEPTAAIRTS